MYAKLLNGVLKTAPKHITVNGNNIWNADATTMLSQGWKPVVFTDHPEAPSGYMYTDGWTEGDDEIVQTWTLTELPDEVDDSEA